MRGGWSEGQSEKGGEEGRKEDVEDAETVEDRCEVLVAIILVYANGYGEKRG